MTEPVPVEGGQQQSSVDGAASTASTNPAAIAAACVQATEVAHQRMQAAAQAAGHRVSGSASE